MNDAHYQNPSNGNVYVFNGGDVEDDEINTDNIEMDVRSRGARPKTQPKREEPLLLERQVEKDDSLLSISLKYGCQV